MPSRRGQGLSRHVGHYIGNEIDNARRKGGDSFAVETMVQLLKGDHLDDQMAALAWLGKQSFVASNKIAVAGVSFGGIQTILGVEKAKYCAAIDAAGAAQSWAKAPQLHQLMLHAVKNAKAPIFFFQAENDYDSCSNPSTISRDEESPQKISSEDLMHLMEKQFRMDMPLVTLEVQYGQKMPLFFCISTVK